MTETLKKGAALKGNCIERYTNVKYKIVEWNFFIGTGVFLNVLDSSHKGVSKI